MDLGRPIATKSELRLLIVRQTERRTRNARHKETAWLLNGLVDSHDRGEFCNRAHVPFGERSDSPIPPECARLGIPRPHSAIIVQSHMHRRPLSMEEVGLLGFLWLEPGHARREHLDRSRNRYGSPWSSRSGSALRSPPHREGEQGLASARVAALPNYALHPTRCSPPVSHDRYLKIIT